MSLDLIVGVNSKHDKLDVNEAPELKKPHPDKIRYNLRELLGMLEKYAPCKSVHPLMKLKNNLLVMVYPFLEIFHGLTSICSAHLTC